MPSEKLKPIQIKRENNIFVISLRTQALEGYQEYNEFGITIPVLNKEADNILRLSGIYLLHLPVTTKETRRIEVEW